MRPVSPAHLAHEGSLLPATESYTAAGPEERAAARHQLRGQTSGAAARPQLVLCPLTGREYKEKIKPAGSLSAERFEMLRFNKM